jgi:hypothetical protein
VNAALPVLAGSLLAEVVLPEAKDAVAALAPHAVEALHDLWSRADDLLHLLSMSAVVTSVGNAYISRAAIEIELAASQPERPDATEPVEPTHVVSVEPTGIVSAPRGQPSSVLPPLGNTDVSGQQVWISTFELLFSEVGTGDEEPEMGSVREATRRTLGIDRLDPPNNIRRVD